MRTELSVLRAVFYLCLFIYLPLTRCEASANDQSRASKSVRSSSASLADLKHGEAQIKRMLLDRPQMTANVSPTNPICSWAIRRFAGEGSTSKIFWNQLPPDWQCIAQHDYPEGYRAGSVRLRLLNKEGKLVDGELLWAGLVFELFNIQHGVEFRKLRDDAFAGKLSREEWVRQNTKLEFEAIRKTEAFYKSEWLKHANNPDPKYAREWFVGTPNSYEKWISSYKNRRGYPYNSWYRFYDEIISPSLNRR